MGYLFRRRMRGEIIIEDPSGNPIKLFQPTTSESKFPTSE